MSIEYPKFRPGKKVVNSQGEIMAALGQTGCRVFVKEKLNGHYHPANVFMIKQKTRNILRNNK